MRNSNDKKIREQVDRLGCPTIGMLDREIARHEKKESYRKLVRGAVIALITTAAVIILITNLWVPVLQIDGSSMNPLLVMDDVVLAVKTDNPEKNDIIAFTHNDKLHVKRVIATAGDWIDISADGVVSVNGEILDEPYVTELSLRDCDIDFPFQVPAETVFVMGDNRPVSMDSRDSQFGTVRREQIIGKVEFRVWPLSQIGSIS